MKKLLLIGLTAIFIFQIGSNTTDTGYVSGDQLPRGKKQVKDAGYVEQQQQSKPEYIEIPGSTPQYIKTFPSGKKENITRGEYLEGTVLENNAPRLKPGKGDTGYLPGFEGSKSNNADYVTAEKAGQNNKKEISEEEKLKQSFKKAVSDGKLTQAFKLLAQLEAIQTAMGEMVSYDSNNRELSELFEELEIEPNRKKSFITFLEKQNKRDFGNLVKEAEKFLNKNAADYAESTLKPEDVKGNYQELPTGDRGYMTVQKDKDLINLTEGIRDILNNANQRPESVESALKKIQKYAKEKNISEPDAFAQIQQEWKSEGYGTEIDGNNNSKTFLNKQLEELGKRARGEVAPPVVGNAPPDEKENILNDPQKIAQQINEGKNNEYRFQVLDAFAEHNNISQIEALKKIQDFITESATDNLKKTISTIKNAQEKFKTAYTKYAELTENGDYQEAGKFQREAKDFVNAVSKRENISATEALNMLDSRSFFGKIKDKVFKNTRNEFIETLKKLAQEEDAESKNTITAKDNNAVDQLSGAIRQDEENARKAEEKETVSHADDATRTTSVLERIKHKVKDTLSKLNPFKKKNNTTDSVINQQPQAGSEKKAAARRQQEEPADPEEQGESESGYRKPKGEVK